MCTKTSFLVRGLSNCTIRKFLNFNMSPCYNFGYTNIHLLICIVSWTYTYTDTESMKTVIDHVYVCGDTLGTRQQGARTQKKTIFFSTILGFKSRNKYSTLEFRYKDTLPQWEQTRRNLRYVTYTYVHVIYVWVEVVC